MARDRERPGAQANRLFHRPRESWPAPGGWSVDVAAAHGREELVRHAAVLRSLLLRGLRVWCHDRRGAGAHLQDGALRDLTLAEGCKRTEPGLQPGSAHPAGLAPGRL